VSRSLSRCDREEQVLELVRTGRWPALADPELTGHVTACQACDDLVAVSSALLADHQAALRAAPIPPSGRVWWRIQRREADEARRAASRTVVAVQLASFAAATAIALAILTSLGDWRSWLKTLGGLITIDPVTTTEIVAQWSLPLALVLATCLALAPVAVYLALARD
jgi:hypothetical protein